MFEEVIRQAVQILEGLRQADRLEKKTAEPSFQDLFEKMDARTFGRTGEGEVADREW